MLPVGRYVAKSKVVVCMVVYPAPAAVFPEIAEKTKLKVTARNLLGTSAFKY